MHVSILITLVKSYMIVILNFATPSFKGQNQASHMCAHEVHTYNTERNSIRNNVI